MNFVRNIDTSQYYWTAFSFLGNALSLSLCSKSLFSQQERKTRVALGGHLSKLLKFLVDFFKMLKTLLLRIVVLDIFDYHDRPRQVTILRIISKLCKTKTAFVDKKSVRSAIIAKFWSVWTRIASTTEHYCTLVMKGTWSSHLSFIRFLIKADLKTTKNSTKKEN